MKQEFLESDMYTPVKEYLEELGYEVKSEIKGCDVVAIKDDELVIIELKRSFQLKLIYQAIERQKNHAYVYIAIPRPIKAQNRSEWKSMIDLLKRLELGLITIAMESEKRWVEVILTPSMKGKKSRKKDQQIRGELLLRTGDFNQGGSYRRKIVTAYREKCIEILCILEKHGRITTKELTKMGFEKEVGLLLNKNYYNWFTKVGKATYELSDLGQETLKLEEYQKLIIYYREKIKKPCI